MIAALADMGAVFTRWQTWRLMADQDIRMRYRRSVLGPLWISLSLATTVVGLALLYGQIFNQEFRSYLPYLAAGLTTWTFISCLVLEGASSLIDAEPQLRSVRIPSSVLAARILYRNFVILAHNAVVMVALVLLLGGAFSWVALLSLCGIAVVAMAAFFLMLVIAPICLRFRDVHQVLATVMQLTFFVTPIFWMPTQGRVSEVIVHVNPFFHLIQIVRAPFLGQQPTPLNWTVALSLVAGLGILAWISTSLTRRKIFLWL